MQRRGFFQTMVAGALACLLPHRTATKAKLLDNVIPLPPEPGYAAIFICGGKGKVGKTIPPLPNVILASPFTFKDEGDAICLAWDGEDSVWRESWRRRGREPGRVTCYFKHEVGCRFDFKTLDPDYASDGRGVWEAFKKKGGG